MKNSLEYVFSGPLYMTITPSVWSKENPDERIAIAAVMARAIQEIQKQCSSMLGDTDVTTSILFNAFTESRVGEFLNEVPYGFSRMYADSGGLQMVTRGLEVTQEQKSEIYRVQSQADFGFCFDQIPLSIKEGAPSNGSHRSQVSSKVFNPDGLDECALATAKNVLEQTERFKGGKTKAFYILQGNTLDDMCRWFDVGFKAIPEENFNFIQGLAPAGTCMGAGVLESVDMVMAAHVLLDRYGPDIVGKHIHLLGFGSPTRLLPAVYLLRSGALGDGMHISSDSSSSSMCFVMGNYVDCTGQPCRRDYTRTMKVFSNFYDQMGHHLESLSPAIDKDRFMRHVKKHHASVSDTVSKADADVATAFRATIPLMCVWQNIGFFNSLKQILEAPESPYTPIGFLEEVRNLSDYKHWTREFSRMVKSNRIERRLETDLMDLFA